MPLLSLCLIAKDEAELLPACLASLRGVVDELVVVDTGSSDATPDIARQAGATVVEHPWREDFAAARNAGLAACSGAWVLILDADERLAPGSGPTLRAALEGASFDCGLLPLHNASALDAAPSSVLSGASRLGPPVLLPRLLRRTPDLAYRGIVHESIGHWIRAGDRAVAELSVPIIHLGAVPSHRLQRGKDARNLALLERRCEQSPDDPVPWGYLARERVRAGDTAGAREAAAAGWAALEATARPGGPNPTMVRLAELRVQLLLADGEPAAALAHLEQCRIWGSEHPTLQLLRALALGRLALSHPTEAEGHLAAAEGALDEALAMAHRRFTEEQIPGASSWEALHQRGLVRLQRGRPTQAAADFEACLSLEPDHRGALLGGAEALVAKGRAREALQRLEPLLASPGPDPWILAALACDRLGSPKDVGPFVRRAVDQLQQGFAAPHRAAQLAELRVAAALYEGALPQGEGQVGRVADLLARRPAPAATAMVDLPALTRLLANLTRAGQGARLGALLEPRAEEVLPGISAGLPPILEQLGLNLRDDGEPEPIFIGGAGRSGTTLFRAMLHAHPRIHCGPEAKLVPAISQLRESWLEGMGPDLAEAGVSPELLDRAVRSFLETLLDGLAPAGLRVAEKTPHNLLHTAYLGRLFPRARFLHVIRDGRAVSSSLLQQRWIDPGTGEPLAYCRDALHAIRYWRDVVATVKQQAREVPGRYLELRYERLVAEPEAVMREVLAFLGEPWDPAVLAHHRGEQSLSSRESSTAAVREAVHTRALEKWRSRLSADELSVIEAEAGPLLRALGYEA